MRAGHFFLTLNRNCKRAGHVPALLRELHGLVPPFALKQLQLLLLLAHDALHGCDGAIHLTHLRQAVVAFAPNNRPTLLARDKIALRRAQCHQPVSDFLLAAAALLFQIGRGARSRRLQCRLVRLDGLAEDLEGQARRGDVLALGTVLFVDGPLGPHQEAKEHVAVADVIDLAGAQKGAHRIALLSLALSVENAQDWHERAHEAGELVGRVVAQVLVLLFEGRQQPTTDAVDGVGRVERRGRQSELLVLLVAVADGGPQHGQPVCEVALVVAAEDEAAVDDLLRRRPARGLVARVPVAERLVHAPLATPRAVVVELEALLHLGHGPVHEGIVPREFRIGHGAVIAQKRARAHPYPYSLQYAVITRTRNCVRLARAVHHRVAARRDARPLLLLPLPARLRLRLWLSLQLSAACELGQALFTLQEGAPRAAAPWQRRHRRRSRHRRSRAPFGA